MTITKCLSETPLKELKRALNSEKEYLYFNISVFNVGAQISIKCSNIYKQINYKTWNGYDFLIINDNITKYYISEEINNRKNNL